MLHVEPARAKINLALHVLGRRSDGYHELDSIVAFADIADRLTFAEGPDWGLDIAGPFAEGLPDASDNLVLKAAYGFAGLYPDFNRTYRITLEKNLPIASGIGSGSADAAACLRALSSLAGVSDDLARLAQDLGADVPVCLVGKTCRMRGAGERIELLDSIAQMPAVLVNPRLELATADVFARLTLRPGDKAFAGLAVPLDLAACRNDLTVSALASAPVIGEVMAVLSVQAGLRFARMSGSGATCFGIFASPEAAHEAAQRIAHAHSDWWVVPTTIG